MPMRAGRLRSAGTLSSATALRLCTLGKKRQADERNRRDKPDGEEGNAPAQIEGRARVRAGSPAIMAMDEPATTGAERGGRS